MQKYGFSGFHKSLNLSKDNSQLLEQVNNLDNKLIHVRVTDIILSDNHPKFNDYGNWNGIGVIEFEFLDKPSTIQNAIAYPYFSNIKNYPLINEIVAIIKSPDRSIDMVSNFTSYYYLPPLNIWNNQHHNAYPNPLNNRNNFKLSNSSNKGEFTEKSNIHPILPFAGDSIYEGRFGNSIRLGSTSKGNFNSWSSSGENGDPILIIRNGQPLNSSDEAWVPQLEDINNDLSSIWSTSTQKIPIKISFSDFSALKNTPVFPQMFNNPQIILSSDRLLLNARKDGVIISGQEFISLNSTKEIGVNAKQAFSVNSSKVNLGNKDADQQLLLGNKVLTQLEYLTQSLVNVIQTLEDTLQSWPGGNAAPHPASIPLGIQKDALEEVLKTVKSGNLLSQVSRTI